MRPTHLDLFAGIGGFSLAAHWAGFNTIAHAEVCPDASRVLEYWWPGVPNLGDVRALDAEKLRLLGPVDLITAGVPCQPASNLGKRRGTADDRWLWSETLGLVRDIRPRYFVAENPPALLSLEGGRAFNGIIGGLAALGYVGFYDVLPAAAIGAGHLRERVIIVTADVHSQRRQGERLLRASKRQSHTEAGRQAEVEPSPDCHSERLEGHAGNGAGESRRNLPPRPASAPLVRGLERDDWLETESPVVPLVYGLPARLAEPALRCVGNTVVPQVALTVLDPVFQELTR